MIDPLGRGESFLWRRGENRGDSHERNHARRVDHASEGIPLLNRQVWPLALVHRGRPSDDDYTHFVGWTTKCYQMSRGVYDP